VDRAPELSAPDDASQAPPPEAKPRRFPSLRRTSSRPSEELEAERKLVEAARRAIVETFGEVPPNLTLKQGDIYQAVDEPEVDRVLLDLPEPWQAVPGAKAALRPGGGWRGKGPASVVEVVTRR